MKIHQAPGGKSSGFSLTDGSVQSTDDRFQTSNMKANQHVGNKCIDAVAGNFKQAAAGVKKPLGVVNGNGLSQITF